MPPPGEPPPMEPPARAPPNEPVETAWPPPIRPPPPPPPGEAEERELMAVEWLPAGAVWLAVTPCPSAVDATCSFCPAPDEDGMYTGLSMEPC
jgi:hypothetical protein